MTGERTITSRDILNLTTAGDVQVSPDGLHVAWVETRVDEKENCYRSRIVWSPWDGAGPRPLTSGPGRDAMPRWSPDGRRVAFLSDRVPDGGAGKIRQVWVIDTGGGEAWRVTDLKHGVRDFSWAPGGGRLAVTAPVNPAGLEFEADPDGWESDPYEKHNRDTRVITRIRYKWDGVGLFDDKRVHLAVVDVPEPGGDIARPRLITGGDYDVLSPQWSPAGEAIAFVSNLDPMADYQVHSDLYVIDASGGTARKLTRSTGPVSDPAWSPGGTSLAYAGHSRPHGSYSSTRLWVVDVDGSEPRCLTRDWDFTVGDCSLSDVRGSGPASPVWCGSGQYIYFPGSVRGRVHLFRVSAAGGDPEALTGGDRIVSGFSACRQAERAAFIVLDGLSPGRVVTARLDDDQMEERLLSDPGGPALAAIQLSRPERFTFPVDGLEVDGWVMRPVGLKPGERCPAVLQVHGGPMAMYGDCFFHEFQLLAARGLAVVYSNPRGSQGYGEEFCAAIRSDWGSLDYSDVMACTDTALERFDFIDGDRLGIAGGSYGGFMTNWAVTHTDRFRAGVTMRSVVNRYSGFGSSDIGYLFAEDLGGMPWEVPMNYLEASPIFHISSCNTPLMIIHSDMDLRCPVDGADQLFVSLKKLGVDTEFVRFSGESHGLSREGKPWHRVFRLDKIVEWMEKYLAN